MNDRTIQDDPLLDLADAVCDEIASKGDLAEMNELLSEDRKSCSRYLNYCWMHAALKLELRANRAAQKICRSIDAESDGSVAGDFAAPGDATPLSGPVVLSVTDIRSPFSYLSSGWPVAYLIATVICGVGLTIAAFTYVSQPTDIAQHSNNSNPQSLIPNPSPKTTIVARITGTADCRWEKKGLGIRDWGLEGMQNEKCKLQKAKLANSKSLNPQIPKSLICLGDQFILSAGLMEITYNTGAKVILQGPCTFEVDSADGGFLTVGKLTARVESGGGGRGTGGGKVASGQWLVASDEMQNEKCKLQNAKLGVASESSLTTNHYPLTTISNPQSLIPNPSSSPQPLVPSPLFAVRTPTATITDLGTEFGVEVDKAGGTTSHVFQGSVRVQTVSDEGKTLHKARVLRENESARVERRDGVNPTIALHAFTSSHLHTFVRELPKPTIKVLDLVDVVAGGDGFSGRRDQGIDPTSGRIAATPPESSDYALHGDGKYHPVEDLPYVDGVFIPDGRAGAVQIDSAGHLFSDFITTHNATYGYIWAGGPIPVAPNLVSRLKHISTELNSVDYSSPGHGVLFLHANKGITFDLLAIRRALPNYRIGRFLATGGNSETISEDEALREKDWPPTYADLWVIVDGKVLFKRREINRATGAFPIAVPIDANNRFLTLAGTDSGNNFHGDWIMFGDPRIELLPNQ